MVKTKNILSAILVAVFALCVIPFFSGCEETGYAYTITVSGGDALTTTVGGDKDAMLASLVVTVTHSTDSTKSFTATGRPACTSKGVSLFWEGNSASGTYTLTVAYPGAKSIELTYTVT